MAIPVKDWHCENSLGNVSLVSSRERRKELTATKVPGKKNIPKMESVFTAELSRLLSIAIVLITALSSLLAFAIIAEVLARLRFVFASFAVMNWYTLGKLSMFL